MLSYNSKSKYLHSNLKCKWTKQMWVCAVITGFVFVQDCSCSTDFSVSAHYPDRLWHHQTAERAASFASEQMWSDSIIFSIYFIPVMSFSILNICATKAAILRSNKAFCLIRMQAADALTCPLSRLPHPTSNAPLIIRNTFPTDSGAPKLDPCQSASSKRNCTNPHAHFSALLS